MGRLPVHDIAKEAGVIVAMVYRLLNSAPGVRDNTVALVQYAVVRLGQLK